MWALESTMKVSAEPLAKVIPGPAEHASQLSGLQSHAKLEYIIKNTELMISRSALCTVEGLSPVSEGMSAVYEKPDVHRSREYLLKEISIVLAS